MARTQAEQKVYDEHDNVVGLLQELRHNGDIDMETYNKIWNAVEDLFGVVCIYYINQ